LRLFLGSFAHIEYLKQIEHKFKKIVEGKWVEKENIHLTYYFLGEVDDPKSIILKLKEIRYKKKDIPIKGISFFGHPPKILYAKIDDKEINKLHKKILKKLDFTDDKPFISHITLCRIKRVRNFTNFIQTIKIFDEKTLGYMHLKLALIKSELTPKGPKYSILKEF